MGVWKSEHLWTSWTSWTRWTLWTGIREPDPKRAFAWLERCYELTPVAEVGNMIARRYVCGEGTERNPEKAKEYYIKGMLQNDDHAIRELQVLMKALRDLKADTESQRIEMYCMRELALRCGAKVLK